MDWGIYDEGTFNPIAIFDTIDDVAPKLDAQTTQYPVEKGSFTNVNKVVQPETVEVKAIRGGEIDEISQTITKLKDYQSSVKIVSVATPFGTFLSMNLLSMKYTHSRTGGASMLIANLSFQQVRQVSPQYTTIVTKNPNYASNRDLGKQQAESSILFRRVRFAHVRPSLPE